MYAELAISHTLDQLPNLRFNDGDVIVKLGKDPRGWLVLHKSIFQATMPVLGLAFGSDWEREQKVTNAVAGIDLVVYNIGLKFVDETYLLEGRVRTIH